MSLPSGMNLHGAVDLSGLVRKAQQAAPTEQQPRSSTAAGLVRDITQDQLPELLELSQTVPVILELYGQGVPAQLGPLMERHGGRLVLATLDATRAPELVKALRVTGIPTVFALLQGRPAPLFEGMPPLEEVEKLFDEVLRVAASAGITGRVAVGPGAEEPSPQEPQGPRFADALEALAVNDFERAEASYREALQTNPKDQEAREGLGRVGILRRIHEAGRSPADIRAQAAEEPDALDAQFLVADLDVSGGHVDDALRRLLDLFQRSSEDNRPAIRSRLVELFDAIGSSHPSVLSARSRLASLLY